MQLSSSVELAYRNLQVPPITLEISPTIGYIQQNNLFLFLKEQTELEDWLLPHPQSKNLYQTLIRICDKLSEYGVYIPNDKYSMKFICLVAQKWLRGESLHEIISEQITYNKEKRRDGSVNSSVRNIMDVINNDIHFKLANALRCYHFLLSTILQDKKLSRESVKLHAFIEVGACKERMINLINMGISREAAKEIDEILTEDVYITSAKDLLNLLYGGRLNTIHSVAQKEIQTLLLK